MKNTFRNYFVRAPAQFRQNAMWNDRSVVIFLRDVYYLSTLAACILRFLRASNWLAILRF
jgi:hypothetical protein